MSPRAHHLLVLAVAVLLSGVHLQAEGFTNPKAIAPPERATPNRRSAAEGVPPLPLPATPLRRSERKRQPAPPALIGTIDFGEGGMQIVNGRRVRVEPFPTTLVDIKPLMRFANNKLGLKYRTQKTTLATFSWSPTELPLLYVTGWTPLPELDPAVVQRLRRYLYDGGTLVLHAQCGRAEFHNSARKLIGRLFPDRPLALLDSDSPLFNACFSIRTMRVRKGSEPMQSVPPLLEAVYLGCRPAVILSAVDLNCSWDIEKHPIRGGVLYHPHDGLQLGTNLVTAVLATFQYARAWSTEKRYPQQDDAVRDELILAQVIHAGDWDPTPQALPALMKYIQSQTTLNVQFKRKVISLTDIDVFQHPVLYITGLRDFKLSDEEIKRLRVYLRSGGVLLAEAAAGNKAFDVAFRREIARVFPDVALETLPAESPLFTMPFDVRTTAVTDLAAARHPGLNQPIIETMTLDGRAAVLYSPLGLGAGWEQLGYAYNRGYRDADALRLGVNLIAYALTH